MSRTRTPQERILAWAVHAPRDEVDLLTRYLKAIAADPAIAAPKVSRKPRPVRRPRAVGENVTLAHDTTTLKAG